MGKEELVENTEEENNKGTNVSPNSFKSALLLPLPLPLPSSSSSSPPKVMKTPSSMSRNDINEGLRREHLKLDLKLVELCAKKKELESKLKFVEGALENERRKNQVPF